MLADFGVGYVWQISLINSPMLNFETSMSGFGMYVKYLMAAFLVVFAMSMLAQFTSYFLNALAIMNGDVSKDDAETGAEQKA